jgi:hypothetical protein
VSDRHHHQRNHRDTRLLLLEGPHSRLSTSFVPLACRFDDECRAQVQENLANRGVNVQRGCTPTRYPPRECCAPPPASCALHARNAHKLWAWCGTSVGAPAASLQRPHPGTGGAWKARLWEVQHNHNAVKA